MKKSSNVYIVLINWNGKADTKACIDSIEKNDYKKYKILLIDNASTDGSGDYFSKHYPQISLIKNLTNIGYSPACNQAIQFLSKIPCDYILFLNNDTIVDKLFLKQLISHMDTNPQVGAVGSKIYFHDRPELIWFAGGKINYEKGLIYHQDYAKKDSADNSKTKEVDFLTGCCLMIRKGILSDIKGFDEEYFAYVEDVDLCFRIKKSGYKIMYIPQSKLWHKVTASSNSNYKEYMITKNTVLFAKKNLDRQTQNKFISSFRKKKLMEMIDNLLHLQFQNFYAKFKGFIA